MLLINSFFHPRCFWPFFICTSICYLALNWIFTINFVWNYDDVFIIVEGFSSYIKGEFSLWEYLTTYRNNHPIIMERIFTVICYWLLGEINIKVIILISSMFPIFLSGLLCYHQPNLLKKFFTHILLLSFTNSIFLWASASAVYFYPMFFLILILLYFLPNDLSLLGLLAFSICLFLMFYSFSNSLAAIPVFGLYFILKKWIAPASGDSIKIIIVLIISCLFLRDYYLTTAYNSVDRVAMNNDLFGSFFELFKGIKFLLIFCGSSAKYFSFSPEVQVWLAFLSGLVMLIVLIYHLYKSQGWPNPWFWMGLFVYLSGLMVMISRFDGSNYYYALDNRYEWYGVINILALVNLLIAREFSLKPIRLRSIFLLFVFVFVGLKTGWNTLNLPRYKLHHERRASDFLNAVDNKDYEIPFDTYNRSLDALKVKPIMEEAEKMGIFHINPTYYLRYSND